MDKNAISSSFAKQAHTYSDYAYVQHNIAKQLMEYVQQYVYAPKSIVDIGTGTGTLLPFIRKAYPDALLYCNDIAQAMLNTLPLDIYDVTECICGDAEEEILPPASLYISNFTFQWFHSLYETIAKLYTRCSVLAFTTLVQETFIEWKELCRMYSLEPMTYTYPSYKELAEYISCLSCKHCYCVEQYYPIEFSNPRSFLQYIKGLGAHIPSKKVFQNYRSLYNIEESFTTRYHIAFVILVKEVI